MAHISISEEKDMGRKKICFAASSGGHYEQLLMLMPLIEKYDSFVLTEKTQYNSKINKKTYHLNQVNRKEKKFILSFVINLIKSVYIYSIEKPDIIITTGVLSIIPMCLICKFFGKKLIYIESYAKVSSPTKTGSFLYKYADRFYVQWESMLKFYPKATYVGGIY